MSDAHEPWRRERKKAATRASIMEAARDLFGERDFDAVSVREIAGDAVIQVREDLVVSRTVHPEVPPRVEYRLTEHGRALQPALRALRDWMRSAEH